MKIGTRRQVKDLRRIWPTEPDFSNWLAKEDGLSLIAEDIGIEIENARRESRPGDYPADIVGHALGDENHVIVIENQFGKTNHDHLGKLLTYAAMHSAMTGIWISEHVSEDHRKVIDWLNDNTPPDVSLFLAQLKAYQIDDSPVAPQLDVVSRPNIQAKLRRTDTDTQSTAIRVWREKFWEEILDYIAEQNPPFSVQSPSDDHWSNIAVGRSDFWIALTLVPKNQRIACELAMNPTWKSTAFAQLLTQREAIERDIGATLDWRELPGKKSARIILEANLDPKDSNNRVAVKQWMHQQAVVFYNTFHDRVRQLQPDAWPTKVPDDRNTSETDEYPDDDGENMVFDAPETVRVNSTTVEVVKTENGVFDQEVEALVNAANEQMRGGGGIDGRFHQRAGKGLLEELERVAPNGTKTADAVITSGHNLKQPHIIHTPGPVWNGGQEGEPDLLASSYRSCLELADKQGLKSIAFCSISTGVFKYPLKEAAPLAVKTVVDYLNAHPQTSLRRIVFAMFKDDEFQEFTQALEAL